MESATSKKVRPQAPTGDTSARVVRNLRDSKNAVSDFPSQQLHRQRQYPDRVTAVTRNAGFYDTVKTAPAETYRGVVPPAKNAWRRYWYCYTNTRAQAGTDIHAFAPLHCRLWIVPGSMSSQIRLCSLMCASGSSDLQQRNRDLDSCTLHQCKSVVVLCYNTTKRGGFLALSPIPATSRSGRTLRRAQTYSQ